MMITRRLLLATALLAISFAIPAGAVPVWENNTDRPGGDYANFDLAPGDDFQSGTAQRAHDCQSACYRDIQCMAWTYVKAGVQGPNPRCWLKNKIPQHRHGNCCVSGFKTQPEVHGPGWGIQIKP